MSERPKEPASKAGVVKATEGSNPSVTARCYLLGPSVEMPGVRFLSGVFECPAPVAACLTARMGFFWLRAAEAGMVWLSNRQARRMSWPRTPARTTGVGRFELSRRRRSASRASCLRVRLAI